MLTAISCFAQTGHLLNDPTKIELYLDSSPYRPNTIYGSYYHGTCISKIPKKIWQTYKTKDLPTPAKKAQTSWIKKNPDYAYELWDDSDIETYILREWDNDTYAFFKALPLGVMKADLWRYLILATEGGIYSDIDSICCRPISSWTPGFFISGGKILLICLENDRHFCQWTIAATPHHPAMEFVCDYLLKNWQKNGIDLTYLHFVHATTGPGIWTDALVAYLGEAPHTAPREIYEKYNNDALYKRKVNELGIFLMPDDFYNDFASKNLYGSSFFGDGYKKWVEERDELYNRNKN